MKYSTFKVFILRYKSIIFTECEQDIISTIITMTDGSND